MMQVSLRRTSCVARMNDTDMINKLCTPNCRKILDNDKDKDKF